MTFSSAPSRLLTSTGVVRLSEVPSPSWPKKFPPQAVRVVKVSGPTLASSTHSSVWHPPAPGCWRPRAPTSPTPSGASASPYATPRRSTYDALYSPPPIRLNGTQNLAGERMLLQKPQTKATQTLFRNASATRARKRPGRTPGRCIGHARDVSESSGSCQAK